ncbi:hypothetical protein RHMOL_Rhmol04G0190500 [Rhododendron molle]|uniref:Uncharacterized protein n=1 Tax=Rhododendron molle TaxID=49168 RepID=A0ACC0P3P4_RHOML|nr:hypothetical protein RHMOL_Rhmol04G0190500 [Rhododendron molle]
MSSGSRDLYDLPLGNRVPRGSDKGKKEDWGGEGEIMARDGEETTPSRKAAAVEVAAATEEAGEVLAVRENTGGGNEGLPSLEEAAAVAASSSAATPGDRGGVSEGLAAVVEAGEGPEAVESASGYGAAVGDVVRLAYAMTINKSHGQSVKFVGVDLRTPVFSHGQLYVALSRCKSFDRLTVLLPKEETDSTTNIVYPEVLL